MLNWALEGIIQGLFTLLVLGIGSIAIWLTIGRWIVRKEVRKHGLEALQKGIHTAFTEPDSQERAMVGELIGLSMSFALNELPKLIPENLNEAPHPFFHSLMRRIETHILKAIMGGMGRVMQKGKEGELPDLGANPIGAITGILGGKNPMGGLGEAFSLLQMFMGQQQGNAGQKSTGGGSGWL